MTELRLGPSVTNFRPGAVLWHYCCLVCYSVDPIHTLSFPLTSGPFRSRNSAPETTPWSLGREGPRGYKPNASIFRPKAATQRSCKISHLIQYNLASVSYFHTLNWVQTWAKLQFSEKIQHRVLVEIGTRKEKKKERKKQASFLCFFSCINYSLQASYFLLFLEACQWGHPLSFIRGYGAPQPADASSERNVRSTISSSSCSWPFHPVTFLTVSNWELLSLSRAGAVKN